jgi:hypothetical protein
MQIVVFLTRAFTLPWMGRLDAIESNRVQVPGGAGQD